MKSGTQRYGTLVALLCLATGSTGVIPLQAQAQEGGGGIEEITVTARKREESVQDVPVLVTALSSEQIRKRDLTSLEKVAAQTPNFNVGRASNGSGAQLTLRGIGSSSTSIGIEQSVAVVVDGVYYGQGRIIQEGFFDLDRIEILKGPQALFFGKNATAGVISIATADPTPEPEFEMRASYEFEASEQTQLELIGSGPITDTLGVRVALRGSKMYDGYFTNEAPRIDNYATFDVATGNLNTHVAEPAARHEPGEDELLGRVTLKWEPNDDLSATLKYTGDYNLVNNSSWNYVAFKCPGGVSQLNGLPCGDHFTTRQVNMPTDMAADFPFTDEDEQLYNRYKSYAITGSVNWALDNMTVTWVTNYQKNNNRWMCNCDFQASPATLWATENATWQAFSTELRLLTSFDGPFNAMVGVLYQDTKRDFEQYIAFGNVEDSTAAPSQRYQGTSKVSNTDGETISPFVQLIWELTANLEATVGARYTDETKDSVFSQPYNNPALTFIFRPADAPDGLGVVAADQSFDDVSPEATLTWRPTDDVMVYGAYKTAYKSGGFSNSGINSAFRTTPEDVTGDFVFDPEQAIDTSGSKQDTARRVDEVYRELQAEARAAVTAR
jgi:outer membrane receptor protein involved in Fe transport